MKILALILALALLPTTVRAQDVDAVILTGVDVSGSINATEIALQLDGLAIAMQSGQIQSAIRHGRRKQIGFAVYLWADSGCPLVVEWRVIASPEDAARIKPEIEARMAEAMAQAAKSSLTDLSKAMECGGGIIAAAPFNADRAVLNIVTNGRDNVGPEGEPGIVRQALQAQRIHINAIALPGGESIATLAPYLTAYVASPIGFVLAVSAAEHLTDAWRRKFLGDIAMVQ